MRSSRCHSTRRSWGRGILLATAIAAGVGGTAGAKPGYLRDPDLQGDQVVFSAEGDLWVASVNGGEARRLTSHPGSEGAPKFSPDGKWIAFAGDYDGNRDVYVVPSQGGEPTRLTWHPAPDDPVGWTPDGSEIFFRSPRQDPQYNSELYRVPAKGGDPVLVPIGYVVTFGVDPETGRYAFTRNGGGGTWKRYRGGTADDIWVGDPKQGDYKQVTKFPGMDAYPMWHGGRIYFLCDEGGTANLWSMNPDGTDRKRLTDFGDWDARMPSMDAATGRIVFTLAGDVHVFDPATGQEHAIAIDLPSERILTRTRYPDPERYMTGFSLAPDGDRVTVEARGEIFSVPAKEGLTLPITRGSGARERNACFDPKGKRVAYVTDETGEEGIVTADAWGRGDVKEVTKPGTSHWHFPPAWSPDGQWIAYADQTHTLYVVKAEGGEPRKVDHCEQTEIREYAWSPDGRWLAYTTYDPVEYGAIMIYDTKDGSTHPVTGFTTNSANPAWDPDGRYLYFLSDRDMNPVLDSVDFESVVLAPTRPYMVLLRKDVENPIAKTEGAPPKDGDKKDKDKGKDKDAKKEGEKKQDEEKPPEPVAIDFDGLADRVVELPVEAGRYYGLAATSKKVFYLSTVARGIADESVFEDPIPKGALMAFDLEKKEAKPFLKDVSAYDLSAKAGKIAVMKGPGELYVLDAGSPPGDDLSESKVALDGMVIEMDPREEWRQIFFEGWREMRDFYWDAGMHGVDWTAVRDQYATLLPRISTRDELRDLIAEMIGELSTSHTYVFGGDRGVSVPEVSTGVLGAVLTRAGNVFQVTRIYRADPADRIRSPLAEPQAAVKEGDYILAVNHQPFAPDRPIEATFQDLAGKEVLLTVNSKADKDGARDVVVKPMRWDQEAELRYADWVRANREYVAQKTGGKIGYIHLPDMGGHGLKEFDTWFYPQLDKEGMVVDARWNGGGFVSQLVLARLLRHLVSWDRSRWGGLSTYPYRMLNGPFVVLTNQFAGSDGDIFPAAVQKLKLAPVIGKRSWGGVIGIRGGRQFVDKGILTQPEFAAWYPNDGWAVENHGVDPDIEIDNLPQDVARGVDPQLDRAIQEVMARHESHPPSKPEFGPAPPRNRAAYKNEHE